MVKPVKKRKLIREARKSGALRAKKRELREKGMSRREARKAAKEMITMSAKPTKEVKSPTREVSVKRSVDPMMSRSRVGKISSPLSDIKSPLSDTKSYLVDNYRVKATDQYRASEYQDRIRQNINSESIARKAGEKKYKRIDPTTGSIVMAKVKQSMKKIKKAPGGGSMKKMPMYKKGGKLKMVMGKDGKMVPFYAADGKGKMAMGGRMGSKEMMESMKKDDKMLKHGGGIMIVVPMKKSNKKDDKKAMYGAKMKKMKKAMYGAKMKK